MSWLRDLFSWLFPRKPKKGERYSTHRPSSTPPDASRSYKVDRVASDEQRDSLLGQVEIPEKGKHQASPEPDLPRKKDVEPTKPPRKHKRLINVGIDFGTSFTKVAFRDYGDSKTYLLTFHEGGKGLPPFYIPSTVEIRDGRLFFAWQALHPKETNFSSFKICLACQEKTRLTGGPCRINLKGDAAPCFTLESGPHPLHITPFELTVSFLSYVIGIAKERVQKKYGDRYDLSITYNMCAPIDQYETVLSKEFEKALFLAERIAGFENGQDLIRALELIRREIVLWPVLPGEDTRTTFIIPETYAAIISYVNSRIAEEGLYGVVDIGSGTTDVAFFRLGISPTKSVTFYEAKTGFIGVDDLVSGIIQESTGKTNKTGSPLRGSAGAEYHCVRTSLIDFPIGEERDLTYFLDGIEHRVDKTRLCGLADSVGGKVFEHYRSTWSQAYKKEKSASRWKQFTVFTLGGGCRISRVVSPLRSLPWDYLENIQRKKLKIYEEVHLDGKGRFTDEFSDLVPIVYGLSFHRAEYAEYKLPHAVGRFRPRLPQREIEDFDLDKY